MVVLHHTYDFLIGIGAAAKGKFLPDRIVPRHTLHHSFIDENGVDGVGTNIAGKIATCGYRHAHGGNEIIVGGKEVHTSVRHLAFVIFYLHQVLSYSVARCSARCSRYRYTRSLTHAFGY